MLLLKIIFYIANVCIINNKTDFSAIHAGHKLAVEVRPDRGDNRGGGDPVPGGDERCRSLRPTGRQSHAAQAPLHAAHPPHRQLRPATCPQLGPAATLAHSRSVYFQIV